MVGVITAEKLAPILTEVSNLITKVEDAAGALDIKVNGDPNNKEGYTNIIYTEDLTGYEGAFCFAQYQEPQGNVELTTSMKGNSASETYACIRLHFNAVEGHKYLAVATFRYTGTVNETINPVGMFTAYQDGSYKTQQTPSEAMGTTITSPYYGEAARAHWINGYGSAYTGQYMRLAIVASGYSTAEGHIELSFQKTDGSYEGEYSFKDLAIVDITELSAADVQAIVNSGYFDLPVVDSGLTGKVETINTKVETLERALGGATELEESIIEKVSNNIFRGVGTFVSDERENAVTGVTITNTDGVISFSGTLVSTINYRPAGLPFALTSGVTYTAKVTVETPVALPESSAFNLYLDGGTAGWLAGLNRTGQVSFTPKKDTVNAQIKLMATTDAAEAMDGAKITVVIVEGTGVPDDYDSDCFSTKLLSKSPVIKTIQGATNGILMTSDEKPLSRLHMPHTFARAFNKIICIGDSLTAGGYEYTSGPSIPAAFSSFAYPEYLSRILGTTVENYGVSGATAVDSTQAQTDHHSWNMLATNNSWLTDSDKGDCYIIYLGTNDIGYYTGFDGVVDTDIADDYNNNAPTSVGGYAKIIQRIKEIQPKAAIFCVGLGNDRNTETTRSVANEKIRAIADKFGAEFLDFQYFGVPSALMADFKATYYSGGHYNTLGYAYRAEEIACYMDYAIRNNVDSFKQIAFIGTDYEYQAQ